MSTIDEGKVARVLDAALTLCISNGSALLAQVAIAASLAETDTACVLSLLVQRGDLLARPGSSYVKPPRRRVRMPGASYPTELRLPLAALMGAR